MARSRNRLWLAAHADGRGIVDNTSHLAEAVEELSREERYLEIHAGLPVRYVTVQAWNDTLQPLWGDWLVRHNQEVWRQVEWCCNKAIGTSLAGLVAGRLQGTYW